MRYNGRSSDAPVVDHVVSLAFEYFGEAVPPAIVRPITPDTLRRVRDLALHVARVCGISEERATDLGLALHELGVNSIVHGRGSGLLRLWRSPRPVGRRWPSIVLTRRT